MPRHVLTEPGPGRPKGSVGGRARALMLLDSILAEEGSQEALCAAMREHLQRDPMKFFRQIVMPLLPQDIRMKLGDQGPVQWASLLATFPVASDSSTAPSQADDGS